MSKKEPMDLTGQKFGNLLIIGYSHKEGNYHYYDCICDCSKGLPDRPVVQIKGKQLRDGSTQSCGCFRSNRAEKLPKGNNAACFSKAEMKELPHFNAIKSIWTTNRSHCNPDNGDGHPSYIKKGIKFCDEWDNGFLGLIFFYVWCIKKNYVTGKSQLHRRDNNLGFSPENCLLIEKPLRKKEGDNAKKRKINNKESNEESFSQTKIINNVFLIDDKEALFKVLLSTLATKTLTDTKLIRVEEYKGKEK